jgi:hypothetical protein
LRFLAMPCPMRPDAPMKPMVCMWISPSNE